LEPAEKCDAYIEDLSTPDRWWFLGVLKLLTSKVSL
jgi:hypothetical protein